MEDACIDDSWSTLPTAGLLMEQKFPSIVNGDDEDRRRGKEIPFSNKHLEANGVFAEKGPFPVAMDGQLL